jgi:hypothetical protein
MVPVGLLAAVVLWCLLVALMLWCLLATLVVWCLLLCAFFSGAAVSCYLWFLYTSWNHGFFINHSLAKGEDKSSEFLSGLGLQYVENSMRVIMKIEGALKYGTLAV